MNAISAFIIAFFLALDPHFDIHEYSSRLFRL
nr:MAG TPA: hypothetical protein [Caudoviricetes sp.]